MEMPGIKFATIAIKSHKLCRKEIILLHDIFRRGGEDIIKDKKETFCYHANTKYRLNSL